MGHLDFQNFQQISNCRSFSYLRAVTGWVNLLQFLIKCQHPRLRTLRPTWIVADSYISAIARVLIYQWIWKFRKRRRRSFVHKILSATHTWAAISNSMFTHFKLRDHTASKVYCLDCSFSCVTTCWLVSMGLVFQTRNFKFLTCA